jgi:hypothetical protein
MTRGADQPDVPPLTLAEVEILLLALELHGEYIMRAHDVAEVAALTERLQWLRSEWLLQESKDAGEREDGMNITDEMVDAAVDYWISRGRIGETFLSHFGMRQVLEAALANVTEPAPGLPLDEDVDDAIETILCGINDGDPDNPYPSHEAVLVAEELRRRCPRRANEDELAISSSRCQLAPPGWWCSRRAGHGGPCAARPMQPKKELSDG